MKPLSKPWFWHSDLLSVLSAVAEWESWNINEIIFIFFTPLDDTIIISRMVRNRLPSDAATYPRKRKLEPRSKNHSFYFEFSLSTREKESRDVLKAPKCYAHLFVLECILPLLVRTKIGQNLNLTNHFQRASGSECMELCPQSRIRCHEFISTKRNNF